MAAYKPDSPEGRFRYDAAAMIKLLILARLGDDPDALSDEAIRRWERGPEILPRAPVASGLKQVQSHLAKITADLTLPSTPADDDDAQTVEELVYYFIKIEALEIAINRAEALEPIDWGAVAKWHTLDRIRDGLDRLPKPNQAERDDPPAETPTKNVFKKKGEYWDIVFAGEKTLLSDSVGLKRIAYLLARRNEQKAVPSTELSNLGVSCNDPAEDAGGVGAGDTRDHVLDEVARSNLKKNLLRIDGEIETAKKEGAGGKAEELEQDKAAIQKQLNKAGGPRGPRLLGKDLPTVAAETIMTGLRREYERLRNEGIGDLAEHLMRSIKKEGTSFTYRPELGTPPWEILQ